MNEKEEWFFICPKCGKSSPLRRHGAVRSGAASIGKRIFGFCSGCGQIPVLGIGWPGFLKVEKRRAPEGAPDSEDPR